MSNQKETYGVFDFVINEEIVVKMPLTNIWRTGKIQGLTGKGEAEVDVDGITYLFQKNRFFMSPRKAMKYLAAELSKLVEEIDGIQKETIQIFRIMVTEDNA